MKIYRKKKKHQSNTLPRTLEHKFKHFLSLLLRFVVGSRPISVTPQSVFKRILVIRQHNQLGDMLCIVPLLRALREKYPAAYIALMASPANYEVMLNNRYVNSVINYDKREILGKGWKGWRHLFSFVKSLRRSRFDLAIVPSTVSTSFTSDMFAYLSGAPIRIGASSLDGRENPSGFWFNVSVELDWGLTPDRHQTLRHLDIAQPLGLTSQNLELEITLDSNEREEANSFLLRRLVNNRISIAYHPGAGKVLNRWDPKTFSQVANALAAEHNAATLITFGPMDDEPVSAMVDSLNVSPIIVRNKPIREVAAILSQVRLVITNDTGIMHVAAAVGVPVLSLFGPTNPRQWAPIGTRNRYIRGEGGDINNITVTEVLAHAREMLGAPSSVEDKGDT